jgi:hypothetical protein
VADGSWLALRHWPAQLLLCRICWSCHACLLQDAAKEELQGLLVKPSLAGIPLLVLGNKNDLPEALSANELISRLGAACWLLHCCRCCPGMLWHKGSCTAQPLPTQTCSCKQSVGPAPELMGCVLFARWPARPGTNPILRPCYCSTLRCRAERCERA